MYFLCRGTARPLCEATTSVLPLFFAACARIQPRHVSTAYTHTQWQYACRIPGPGTEAASAFLLYYV